MDSNGKPAGGAPPFDETTFSYLWDEYAREKSLPADPSAWQVLTMAEWRREAMRWYGHGAGRRDALERRCRELFP